MVQYILAVFRKCHSWKKLQNYNPSDSLKRRYKKKKGNGVLLIPVLSKLLRKK